jgi:hypothetical protein
MAEVNWNLLNTNAPAQIAASLDPMGSWNKGQMNALAMQDAQHQQQMNALQMQKAQRMEREAPMAQQMKMQEAAQKQQMAGIEQELKMHTIRKQSADAVASAPPELAWQTFAQEAQRIAQLNGSDPTAAMEHGKQVMAQGGPQALQQEAMKTSLDAKDKLSKIQLVNAGKETVFAETNPNAAGFSGQPIQMQASPGQELAAQTSRMQAERGSGAGGGTPYFVPIQTPEGVVSFDARRGTMTQMGVDGRPVIGSASSPALQGELAEAKKTGTGMGENNMEQYQAAQAAPNKIKDLDKLLTHLESSDAETGLGAEMFKNIERAKALMGSDAAAGKVKDTELLDTMMGAAVFPMISSLGVGARGMDTPAEREFMRSVLTGSISLNKGTLVEMAKIRKNIEKRALDKWNKRVEKGELNRFFEHTGIPKEGMQAEQPSPTQAAAPPSQSLITVTNPQTGEQEVWDTVSEQRVR